MAAKVLLANMNAREAAANEMPRAMQLCGEVMLLVVEIFRNDDATI